MQCFVAALTLLLAAATYGNPTKFEETFERKYTIPKSFFCDFVKYRFMIQNIYGKNLGILMIL